VASPYAASAFIEIDLGDPPLPGGNLSPDADFGGHGNAPKSPAATAMIEQFLFGGVIDVPCDGTCDPD
jgi:hypothetical protein